MEEDVIVAVDLGTTGSRVVAFDGVGRLLDSTYEEITQHFPAPGWVEQDPEEIAEKTRRLLRRVVGAVGPARVRSVGITNQRETTILWERSTGRPVHRAIVWQDRRTEPLCRSLEARGPEVFERTGLFLDPYFSATKIRWLLDRDADLRRRAEAGEIAFGTPDTWLLWQLTGGATHATEPSNASRTLLMKLHTLTFDPHLLDLFDIPKEILPAIEPSDATFGWTEPSLTDRPIPLVGVLGDQQASLFGQGGGEKGVLKNTYGTGLFVLGSTGRNLTNATNLLTTVAWKRRGETSYALEGSVFMGGAVLQWLRDKLGLLEDAAESGPLAASVESNDGVYLVPGFQGLGAPYWIPEVRAEITGLTSRASRATLVRAAVEALAYQTRDVVDAIRASTTDRIGLLRADGGASRNDFLMQFQADILGLPVDRVSRAETTSLGVAGLSGIATGLWDDEGFRRLLGVDRRFEPSMSPGSRDRHYHGWQRAVRKAMG